MRVIVQHVRDTKGPGPGVGATRTAGRVTVQVVDETGAAMESGVGTQVPDAGVELPIGQQVALEISDHEGGEPDLDDLQVGAPGEDAGS